MRAEQKNQGKGHVIFVAGPNLNDQSKGSFHAHAAGCRDATKYGFGKQHGGDDEGWTLRADDWRDVVEDIFYDQIIENDEEPDDYFGEVWFAPCCRREMLEGEKNG